MKKFKDNLILLETSTLNSFSEMKTAALNPSRKMKIFGFMGVVLFVMIAITGFTLAARGDSSIWGKITDTLDSVYGNVVGISTALTVLCVVIGLICAQLTTNQQKTARWVDFVKKAVIIWIILNSLLFIMKFLKDMTDGGQLEHIKDV